MNMTGRGGAALAAIVLMLWGPVLLADEALEGRVRELTAKVQQLDDRVKQLEQRALPAGVAPTLAPGGRAGETVAGQTDRLVNSIGVALILVSPGELTVPDRGTGATRTLAIDRAFRLGKFEVTQEQWQKVMGSDPSVYKGSDHPVEMVSWLDCMEFCDKLSALEGRRYRLPTAEEWEYACRAGSKGDFCFGDDEAKLGEYAWYGANSGAGVDANGHAVSSTHPVGQKKPNAWGFFDMHGNVNEWCQDKGTPSEQAVAHRVRLLAERGTPMPGSWRLMGGGSFAFQQAPACWCYRWQPYPDTDRSFVLGFRVALELEAPKGEQP